MADATNSEETTVSKESTFIHYPHIDKLKVGENFLSKYECRIFPKLDGSNCQINYDITKCKLNFGSRNRALTVEDDMCNFMGTFSKNKKINDFFAMSKNQNLTLFGEYMINNRKNQYKPEYSKAFIIFDVAREGHYLDYDEYKILLDMFNLEYVEPLAFNDNQTIYELVASFKSKYVNENGKDEGIVIKRKGEIPFDEHRMFKLISEEWTQVRIEKAGKIESDQIDNDVLSELKATYCTNSYINKELGKIFPEPISDDYKEDVANFGRGKVIQHIMKDFTRIELAVLKGTKNECYVKYLKNFMAQKILDLF